LLFAGTHKADILVCIRLRWAVFWFPLFARRQGTIWWVGMVHSLWHAGNQSCRVCCGGVGLCAARSVGLRSDAGVLRPTAKWPTLNSKETRV